MDTTFAEVDEGVFHVPTTMEGTSWTVWVDGDEAQHGFVRTHPYLSPLGWWLIGADVELVDESGQTLGLLETDGLLLDGRDTDVVLGPEGWLVDVAGRWATVRVSEGALCWSPCEEPPVASEAQIAAIRTGFERALATEGRAPSDRPTPEGLHFAGSDGPMHEALFVDRDAFVDAPIPPLPALYEAAGLVEQGGIIAESDFDWEALRAWQTSNRLAFSYGLAGDQVDDLMALMTAFETSLTGAALENDAEAARLAAILDDGAMADAFWAEVGTRDRSVDELRRFADDLATRLDTAPVGLAWLRARCLDHSGDTAAAVELLEAAIPSDSTHVHALVDLAGFAADRGDAAAAYRYLQRAGVSERVIDEDDDEPDDAEMLLDEVEGYALNRPRPQAGRNDPCPCGSGRKYKVCHLGRERHSLDDRAGWLYQKAQRFLRSRAGDLVDDLTTTMADPIDLHEQYEYLLETPFVADLVLHEMELFAEFLAARDRLLPDDEAMLGAQWALVDRSAFEVERVHRDSLELYDIATAERITVVNTRPGERTRPGVVMLGRPLPVGEAHRAFSGFMEVPRALVDDLLRACRDRDAFEIASLVGRTLLPPRLSNTDGEDLVFHTMRWRVDRPDEVEAALGGAGLLADDEEPSWRLVRDSINGRDTIVASVRRADGELVGEVNSDERAEELMAVIAEALPDAELVDDEVRSMAEVAASVDSAATPRRSDVDDPVLRQVMAEYIADYERRWLDESIPALGGRTPRDAAADPIGREELEQLLAGFPEPDPDVGGMSPGRLRRALDL